MIPYVVFGLTYGFACAVQPGPFQAYLVLLALADGWRRALPAALAPLLSDGPIALAALFVLSHLPGRALQGLRLTGGAFLLFLAYGAYRSWRAAAMTEARDVGSPARNLFQAAVVNLLNPNLYLGLELGHGPAAPQGLAGGARFRGRLVVSFYATIVVAQAGIGAAVVRRPEPRPNSEPGAGGRLGHRPGRVRDLSALGGGRGGAGRLTFRRESRCKSTPSRELVPVLQTAIGPVILISGVGLLLLLMTNRLGRIIDRARSLAASRKAASGEALRPIEAQLAILGGARLIQAAIALAATSDLAARCWSSPCFSPRCCAWRSAWIVGGLFCLCLAGTCSVPVVFIRDINLSLAALRLELQVDDKPAGTSVLEREHRRGVRNSRGNQFD